MNNNQKIVLAIFVPIIFFFIALLSGKMAMSYTRSILYDLGEIWYVWYLVACCLFEFLLFRDKKREIKK